MPRSMITKPQVPAVAAPDERIDEYFVPTSINLEVYPAPVCAGFYIFNKKYNTFTGPWRSHSAVLSHLASSDPLAFEEMVVECDERRMLDIQAVVGAMDWA